MSESSTATSATSSNTHVGRAQRKKAVDKPKPKMSRSDKWIEENNDAIVDAFVSLGESLSGPTKKEGKHDLYNFAQVVCDCFNPFLPRVVTDDDTDDEEDAANFAGDGLCSEDREDLLEKDEDIEGDDLADVDDEVAEEDAAVAAAEDDDPDADFDEEEEDEESLEMDEEGDNDDDDGDDAEDDE